MADKQVLFRIDADLLAKLDRKLKQKGYATRNAWFKDVVKRQTAPKRRKK